MRSTGHVAASTGNAVSETEKAHFCFHMVYVNLNISKSSQRGLTATLLGGARLHSHLVPHSVTGHWHSLEWRGDSGSPGAKTDWKRSFLACTVTRRKWIPLENLSMKYRIPKSFGILNESPGCGGRGQLLTSRMYLVKDNWPQRPPLMRSPRTSNPDLITVSCLPVQQELLEKHQ